MQIKKKSSLIIMKVQHTCTFIVNSILIYLIQNNIICVANYVREIKLEFFCIKITDLTIMELGHVMVLIFTS